MIKEQPVITVSVITYNHARFVRQALDSILMQDVNVPYEVIVMDDASTDGTQDILCEYRRKHPDIIRLYMRRHNSGAWPTKNGWFLGERVRGRYSAVLEGDDYWTDPHKLQMQYDFLVAHPEFSACVTRFTAVDGDDNPVECHKGDFQPDGVFTLENFRRREYVGQTLTLFSRIYRGMDRESLRITYEADRIMGDITGYMLLLCHGDIAQLPTVTAAYRWQHAAGGENWNSKIVSDPYHRYNMLQFHARLDRYLKQHTGRGLAPGIIRNEYFALSPDMPLSALWNMTREIYPRREGLMLFLSHLLKTGEEAWIRGENQRPTGLPRDLWTRPLILFGAGRLCGLFLQKEGWRENIRFIVDNNEELWGTTKYGCYVKPPKELWIWRKKANILIFNAKHEQEIYTQAKALGAEHVYCWHSAVHESLRNRLARWLLDHA